MSNSTAIWCDFATFNDIEKEFYGGPLPFYIKPIQKSEWMHQIPIKPIKCNETSFLIPRARSMVKNFWVDIHIEPEADFKSIPNLAHYLCKSISITTNGKVIWIISGEALDFLMHLENKSKKYRKAISSIPDLCLPIPFNTELVVGALPYSEMYLNFELRNIKAKVTLQPWMMGVEGTGDFRKRIACQPFKLIAEQYQTFTKALPSSNVVDVELPFTGAVKAIMFAIRKVKTEEKKIETQESSSDIVDSISGWISSFTKEYRNGIAKELPVDQESVYLSDTVSNCRLLYGQVERLNSPAHHLSFINPYHHTEQKDSEGDDCDIYLIPFCLGKLNDIHTGASVNFDNLRKNETSITLELTLKTSLENCELVAVAISRSIINVSGGSASLQV